MEYIDIKFMSAPHAHLNEKPISFPCKKAEALFFYIAVKKTVTHDQAAAVFWSNLGWKVAKQNIRQILYVLKKTFGNSVIKALLNHQLGFSNVKEWLEKKRESARSFFLLNCLEYMQTFVSILGGNNQMARHLLDMVTNLILEQQKAGRILPE